MASTKRRVFVSGDYGETPTCVSASIERAMIEAEKCHLHVDAQGPTAEWICTFVDGWLLRCEATVLDGEAIRLYVEAMELDEGDDVLPEFAE